MRKKIIAYDEDNGLILFTPKELEKYGLHVGKSVKIELVKRATYNKPAEIEITVLD